MSHSIFQARGIAVVRRRQWDGVGAQRVRGLAVGRRWRDRSPRSSRAWTTRSSSAWSRASRTRPRPAASKVTVQAANSITDTTGQADKLNGLAGQDYSCFMVNPISGTNLIQGIAQLVGEEQADRQHRQPDRRRAPPRPPTPRSPPTSAPTTRDAGEQGRPPRWPSCCPRAARSRSIGGIAGDVTSARPARRASPEGVGGNLQIVSDGGRRLGSPDGADQGDRHHARQPGPRRRSSSPTTTWASASPGPSPTPARPARSRSSASTATRTRFEAVKAGGLDAVVAQYPYAIGAMGVEACQAASAGQDAARQRQGPGRAGHQGQRRRRRCAATPKPFGTVRRPVRGRCIK